MLPKKEGSKTIMACSKCSYKTKEKAEAVIKETVHKKPEMKMDIVEEESTGHAMTEKECPKCKHTKAYTWELQTRAGDEPPTRFFKCEKCKHTWREYHQS